MSFDFNNIRNTTSADFKEMHVQSVKNLIKNNILMPLYKEGEKFPEMPENYIKENIVDIDMHDDNITVDIKYDSLHPFPFDKDYTPILMGTLIKLLCINYSYIKNSVSFTTKIENPAVMLNDMSTFNISCSSENITIDIGLLTTWIDIMLSSLGQHTYMHILYAPAFDSSHITNTLAFYDMLKSLDESARTKIKLSVNLKAYLKKFFKIQGDYIFCQNTLDDIVHSIKIYGGEPDIL